MQIPPGTLIQIPNTEEYFAVLGGTDVPTTYGEIVVRTDALRTFQKEYIQEKEKRVHQAKLDANDGNEPTIETVNADAPVLQPPVKVQTTKHKLRANSLDVPIAKAVKQAGSLIMASVYLKLRELALGGESPFLGTTDGNALCYTNDKNQSDKLTKNALGKRLKNHRL